MCLSEFNFQNIKAALASVGFISRHLLLLSGAAVLGFQGSVIDVLSFSVSLYSSGHLHHPSELSRHTQPPATLSATRPLSLLLSAYIYFVCPKTHMFFSLHHSGCCSSESVIKSKYLLVCRSACDAPASICSDLLHKAQRAKRGWSRKIRARSR